MKTLFTILKLPDCRFRCIFTALSAFVFIMMCISCNKIPGPFDPFDNPETIDGFLNLGAGYDVFDNFADEAKVGEHILDYGKLNAASVPPSKIFDLYGTHCLTGVIVGARSDYSVSGRTRDVREGVSVAVYAEASFSS